MNAPNDYAVLRQELEWLRLENRAMEQELLEVRARLQNLSRTRVITLQEAEQTELAAREDWNPELLCEFGWERDFQPGLPRSDYFEILRSQRVQHGMREFVLLCPSFIEAPLMFEADANTKFHL